MDEQVKVYYLRPGHQPQWKTITNDLPSLVALIDGGYLEQLSIKGGLSVLMDEDGIEKGLLPNFTIMGVGVRGPAILCRYDAKGDMIDVTEDDVALFQEHLHQFGFK